MAITKQEYYDLLVKTSEEGKFPCNMKDLALCLYHREDGAKCAAGLLIPDDRYNKDIELHGGVLDIFPRRYIDLVPNDMTLLDVAYCQKIHDNMTRDMFVSNTLKWNHNEFVNNLNQLDCFNNINRGLYG